MFVESPTNPLVKTLRSLADTRHIREQGLFLVEGVRAVEDGLDAGHWPGICLYNPELLARTPRGRELTARLRRGRKGPPGAQVVEASTRAIEAAALTQHPQGVVAAFPITENEPLPPSPGRVSLCLICDVIQDPGNLGTMLRTAEAGGCSGVWLTPHCVYAFNPKVVRAAMGAHFRLPIFPESSWADIARALEVSRVGSQDVYALDAGAELAYDRVDWTAPAALIVSNEAHGLTSAAVEFIRERGAALLTIPMAGGTESLNASIAAAVVTFEAARQRRAATIADEQAQATLAKDG